MNVVIGFARLDAGVVETVEIRSDTVAPQKDPTSDR